ncbi:MAG TPA: NAD(P)-dependent oxidoreductase [Cellulomonas sp.]
MDDERAGGRGTVVITARNVRLDGRAAPLLRQRGWHVVEAQPAQPPSLTPDEAWDVVALVVGSDVVDQSTIAPYPNLACIVRSGAGTDNVRLPAGSGHVAVTGLPGLNAQSVADYTFGLMLAASRRIAEADRLVRRGEWSPLTGADLYRRTLGVLGFGAVGRAVAARARGFEMPVLAYDPMAPATDAGVRTATLREVLAEADVVTLHVPLTPETRRMIGAPELALMKPTALLVNAARGGLVDEGSLIDALRRRVIAGAALDVFDDEPGLRPEWRELDNVVLSPHTASFGTTTMDRLAPEVADAVERLLAGRSARGDGDLVPPPSHGRSS